MFIIYSYLNMMVYLQHLFLVYMMLIQSTNLLVKIHLEPYISVKVELIFLKFLKIIMGIVHPKIMLFILSF